MILGNSPLELSLILKEFSQHHIQPASIDLHIGDSWAFPVRHGLSAHVLGEPMEYGRMTEEEFTLLPGRFVLGRTQEFIRLNEKQAGFVDGRSSTGRQGLFVQNAGFCDPGFEGTITLELFNALPFPLTIKAGTRLAQLVVCDVRGCTKPYSGKYQGQIDATGAIVDKEE